MRCNGYNTKIGNIGPFEIIGNGNSCDNVGLRDRLGRWVVSPELGYRSFTHYDDGLMIAYRSINDGYSWVLVDYHGNCISDRYNFIEPAGEGFFVVEKGARHNIMRRDGSLVLKEWPHRVSGVREGYFITGNTIRKTKTTPTRYVSGVAHVSGIVVFPMIFNSARFSEEPSDTNIYVEIDGLPYVVQNGALFDTQKRHYPSQEEPQLALKAFQETVSWILQGLQMYYRDTDADIDVEKMYPVGKVLRTGFNTSVSTKLQRPAHKTRFLIASAHTALLCSDDNGKGNETALRFSPCAEEWRHAVVSKNAWLKVLDIYKVGEFTQVFMIQIPESAVQVFAENETIVDLITGAINGDVSLIDIARRNFDEKLRQLVHPRSTDHDFVALMSRPVGYDINLQAYAIEPDFTLELNPVGLKEYDISNSRYYNYIIHGLAQDQDIPKDYDGFPWRGIVGSVCDGCMYANGIDGVPIGCGRLFEKSFRKSYISGECDYWKYDLWTDSDFELFSRMRREKQTEHDLKVSGSYACSLVRDFISDYLDGDIERLLVFDFRVLKDDKKYGPIKGPAIVENYAIVKSIVEIAFGDCWPDLNVETLDNYQYQIGTMIKYGRLAGSRIQERHFKALDAYAQPAELIDLAEELHSHVYKLGDFIVWPNKANLSNIFDDSKMRGYIDRMFIAMYDVMTDAKKQNMDVKGALYKNRKLMCGYPGRDGFLRFMRNSCLEDFLDEDGSPRLLFDGISNSARDFNPLLLPDALRQYSNFMIRTAQRRSRRILNALKSKLKLD